jgi:hypothetical protein
MVKVSSSILPTLSLVEVLIFSLIVPDVHIQTQVLQSPKPEISTYFHQGTSKRIYRLCGMRTPHLHSSMCSESKITKLTLLLQLIPCKESVLPVYYQKYSLPVSRTELPKQDCHVVLNKLV